MGAIVMTMWKIKVNHYNPIAALISRNNNAFGTVQ
jgi:hypothetical protein